MHECIQAVDGYIVTLDHLKEHLRLTNADEDRYLEHLIKTAGVFVENYLERTLLLKTWRVRQGETGSLPIFRLIHLRPPIVSIVSANEINVDGSAHKIKRYMLTPNAMRPRINVWGSCVEFTYKSGYGETSSSIPLPIRQAALMLAAEMFVKRVDLIEAFSNATIKQLLQPYRVMTWA